MNIIVTGSLAYDHIMVFPGYFKDHILPDKVHVLNVSFLVDHMIKKRGGCACNIAYSLALLGERPHIMGTVGEDFDEYRAWLEECGIDTSAIKAIKGELTATCTIITDRADNQITGFYAGAMSQAHILSFKDQHYSDIDLVIISPNDPKAMVRYVRECHELGIPYIYDPSQQIIRLSAEELIAGTSGSRMLVVNDYECEMIRNKTALSEEELLNLTEILIITRGEEGSLIKTNEKVIEIPIAVPKQLVDPTGAGDAYRAGIIKGLIHGYPLEVVGRLGSLTATYSIEEHGTQTHHFTLSEFVARYQENFGDTEGLDRLLELR
ncbi:MAG: carbohydrate kinase family protein [Anaerolineae bacterium]